MARQGPGTRGSGNRDVPADLHAAGHQGLRREDPGLLGRELRARLLPRRLPDHLGHHGQEEGRRTGSTQLKD